MKAHTYSQLVAAAKKAQRMRRPGWKLRLAVWRLKRIDPRNPAFKDTSVKTKGYLNLHQYDD